MDEALIGRIPLFESLPQAEIEYLAATLRRLELADREILVREGAPGDRCFILLEGRVEVIKAISTPAEHSLGFRKSGALIGEMSLLTHEGLRVATIIARSSLRVLEITRDEFDALLARHPTLAYSITKMISERMSEMGDLATRDLLEANQQLLQAYDATIEGWSRAMNLRDKETEGHLERVRDLTVQLAQSVGLAGEEIMHVKRGALLHDMGKLGVPDHILLKPGKLTDEEWETMRKHPQYAYDMLESIDYLRPALDIPYCHHEKWDGSGYPRGLKGEEIPMAARLFAIVDVWDALRSDRPYRASWPEEKVLAHIRSAAGTHFDPQAVDLFMQMMSPRGN